MSSGERSIFVTGPAGPDEPTFRPVLIEPSPPGSDDTARLLSVATFIGLCRVITTLADRRLLCPDELRGIEDAMSTPLDDAEWRDDEVIASFRATATEVLAACVERLSGYRS